MKEHVINEKHSMYSEELYQRREFAQTEMIKRAYPRYNKGNDWVLWLVADLYHDNEPENLSCKIIIENEDGSVYDIPYKLRKPYPNKKITQVCMTDDGRKKNIFGIPVVVSSFEELCKIKNITIKWSFFEKCGIAENNKNVSCQYITTEIHYGVSFTKNAEFPEARMFTLNSQAISAITEFGNKTEEEMEIYLSKFDFVTYAEAVIGLENLSVSHTIIEEMEYYKRTGYSDVKVRNQLQKYTGKFKDLSNESFNIESVARDVKMQQAVQYYPMACEKDVVLTAMQTADIPAEPSWGFAKIL